MVSDNKLKLDSFKAQADAIMLETMKKGADLCPLLFLPTIPYLAFLGVCVMMIVSQ